MEERHRILLFKQNPQWTGTPPTVPAFERDLLSMLEKYVPAKQVLAVVGLRRTGKTVLLKQLMRKAPAPSQNICYISFDDRDFQSYDLAFELIYYFLQRAGAGRRYLLLDEIQKVPDWPDLLKTLYDTEENLKIILSGSSSLELRRSKETLAGRLLTFSLPIFSFREFVRYHGMEWRTTGKTVFRQYDLVFLPRKRRYEELFRDYLLRGAFPELAEQTDEEFVKRYIAELIDKVVTDISRIVPRAKEQAIHDLILLFCKSTGQLFELNNLAALLKVNRLTAARYVRLLEKSFLLNTSYNATASVARRIRTGKKGYIAHSCIAAAALDYPSDITTFESDTLGHLVETAVASNLRTRSFWRQQRYEVDFVLKDGTPAELKYQATLSPADRKPLLEYLNQRNRTRGLLLTKGTFKREKTGGKEILMMPVWLFLLLE